MYWFLILFFSFLLQNVVIIVWPMVMEYNGEY